MFEALVGMTGGPPPIQIPVTPGPTTLATGNMQQGYYGEVSAAEFISGSALAAAVGLSAGTLINDAINWIKLAYNGKTQFIPKRCIRNNVSWSQMNAAGVVLPSSNKTVVIAGQTFLVRLMKGANEDPFTGTSGGSDVPQTWGSEFNTLMYNLITGLNPASETGPQLASYTYGDLGMSPLGPGSCYICQELFPGGTNCLQRGNGSGLGATSYQVLITNGDAYRGWRPVLELMLPE